MKQQDTRLVEYTSMIFRGNLFIEAAVCISAVAPNWRGRLDTREMKQFQLFPCESVYTGAAPVRADVKIVVMVSCCMGGMVEVE